MIDGQADATRPAGKEALRVGSHDAVAPGAVDHADRVVNRRPLITVQCRCDMSPLGEPLNGRKYAWIDEYRDQFAVTRMCRLLLVSRTGYFQWRERAPSERSIANSVLDVQVTAIHAGSRRSYGRPRILRELRMQGAAPGHERVRKNLQRQKLRPVYRRPYRVTTDSKHTKPIAPNTLDRRFDGWPVTRAWVGDITYIATGEGWLYLAVIMDLGSRRIVGWSMNDRIKADLVCQALTSAYWRRKPGAGLIMHTDRGSQPGLNWSSQHGADLLSVTVH